MLLQIVQAVLQQLEGGLKVQSLEELGAGFLGHVSKTPGNGADLPSQKASELVEVLTTQPYDMKAVHTEVQTHVRQRATRFDKLRLRE